MTDSRILIGKAESGVPLSIEERVGNSINAPRREEPTSPLAASRTLNTNILHIQAGDIRAIWLKNMLTVSPSLLFAFSSSRLPAWRKQKCDSASIQLADWHWRNALSSQLGLLEADYNYIGSSNSNDAVHISLVAPAEGGTKAIHTFNPKFTYPIFGDEERIFGYQGLKINLRYNACDMRPGLQISYTKKFKTVGETSPTDLKAVLEPFLPKSTHIPRSDEYN